MGATLSPLEEAIYRFIRPRIPTLDKLWPKAIMGSGRHVRHVRMAVSYLHVVEEGHIATYYVVAGIAPAYASINALLVFLNSWYELEDESTGSDPGYQGLSWPEPGPRIRRGNPKFIKKLEAAGFEEACVTNGCGSDLWQ